MGTFYLRANDTRDVLEATLLKPDGTAYNLTGATSVTLHIKLASGTTLSRTMTVNPDPATGIVTYTWLAADWTGSPCLAMGTHRMVYEVIGPALARKTFPTTDEDIDTLEISEDIGQA